MFPFLDALTSAVKDKYANVDLMPALSETKDGSQRKTIFLKKIEKSSSVTGTADSGRSFRFEGWRPTEAPQSKLWRSRGGVKAAANVVARHCFRPRQTFPTHQSFRFDLQQSLFWTLSHNGFFRNWGETRF